MPKKFNDKNKMWIMNDAIGPGGSAVVIASRGAKDVMRKLVVMEKNLCEKQENER